MWDPEIKWTLWTVALAALAGLVATLIYSAIAK